MTAAEFMAWVKDRHLSERAAAEALGIARASVVKYKRLGAPLKVKRLCDAYDRERSLMKTRVTYRFCYETVRQNLKSGAFDHRYDGLAERIEKRLLKVLPDCDVTVKVVTNPPGRNFFSYGFPGAEEPADTEAFEDKLLAAWAGALEAELRASANR